MKKTSGMLEKFIDSASTKLSTYSDKEHATAAELALTYHAVKHNLSYNSMDCAVKLNKIIYDGSSKASDYICLARTKMESLVTEVLGPYAIQNVIDDLNNDSMFYCLQTDASNKKNIKLFPLVVQYFTAKNGIQNKLLDFYENSNESADGMFHAIQKSMEQYKLSFSNVSALSADNTNANFGVNHSLFTNIRDLAPDIIKGNCHAHIVHNCMKHAMGFLMYDIENVVLKIYSHFSHSAVRREELKKFVASVNGDFHEIKRHVGTRWLSLLPCIDTLLLNWKAIKNYFISLEHCPLLLENLLMLNKQDDLIDIYLHFSSHILNLFNKTVKCLEGNSITVLDVFNIMINLKNGLTQRKQDLFFGYETGKKLKILSLPELINKIQNNFILFIDKALEYLNKWFDFSDTNWLFKLSSINLKSNLNFDCFVSIIENLKLSKLGINMDDLYGEISLLNKMYDQIYTEEFSNLSTAQKWQEIFKNSENNFINLYKVISFLLSIPATSAFTERVFSLMNLKWRDERNKASLNLIKNELFIYLNLSIKCSEALKVFSNEDYLLKIAKSNKKYAFKCANNANK